jgi:Spy/CpxP family protein refolding chaperone
MKTFRISTSLSIFGLLVTMAGCSANTAPASGEPATASQAQAANADKARPMHHGFFGPEHLLVVALHEDIGLSDAQKNTIRTALDGARPAPPSGMEEKMKAHSAKLAAAVRAGKIDVATLAADGPGQPDQAAMTAHLEAAKKALTTLHATLTPEQRQKLVAAVESHKGPGGHGGPFGHHGGHHGGPPPEGRDGEGRGPRPEGMHGAFGLLQDLDLTDAQKEQIRTKLQANRPSPPSEADREAMKTKFEAMRAEHKARLESFTKDTFDANAFLAKPANAPEPGKGMKGMHEHMLNELAAITEVLTPAQREKLAARIEKGPEHKGPPPGAR